MAEFSFGHRLMRLLAAMSVAAVAGASVNAASAQVGSDRYASIVIDAATGNILSAVNADEARFPASLTKMMTIYMLFEALRDRRLNLSQPVPVSARAASMSPTKLGLLPGTYITVEQALLGLVTKSANDAAAALGEMMGGDEERFAQMMTLRARALGMAQTTFRNASGLPDWSQVTTARDMAVLGRRLIQDFPGYYHYFSEPSFVFQGRTILNHQRLLQSYPGADGLKTGYIGASGFNVVTSAVRADTRLVGVVLGAASGGERDLHMASLLDTGFDQKGAPMLTARYEPPSGYRLGSFISLAEAAPVAAPPPLRPYAAATFRGGRRLVSLRTAQAAVPAAQQARTPRRALDLQLQAPNSRSRSRSVVALAPFRSGMVIPPRSVSVVRAASPARVIRSKGTRTANGTSAGRSPG